MTEIERHEGIKYDPSVILAAKPVVDALEKSFCCIMDAREKQCPPEELCPGMRLSRYVRTGTGLFFMSAGTELTRENINLLNRISAIDPPAQSVFICTTKK